MEARQYIQGVNYQTYKDPQRFSMHTWVAIYVQGQKKGKMEGNMGRTIQNKQKKERGEKKGGKRKEIVQKKYVIIFSRRFSQLDIF